MVVLDNASIHHSAAFDNRLEQWAEQGLLFYFLPPYCPELNLIEKLWKMIKYHWLPLSAYESFQHLVESVDDVCSTRSALTSKLLSHPIACLQERTPERVLTILAPVHTLVRLCLLF